MTEANILIADDGRAMRMVLSNRLRDKGYTVAEAADGQEAVDLVAEQGNFDLVLLDIQMPEKDGITALRELRKTHSQTQLPIIMATANDEEDEVVRAFELGANDFVSKPINFPILMARIVTQLKLKRATEELERRPEG